MSQQPPPPSSSGGGYYHSQAQSQYPHQQAPYPAQYPQQPQYQPQQPSGYPPPPPPQQPGYGPPPPPFGYQPSGAGMPDQPPPKKSRRLPAILGAVGGMAVLGVAGLVISNLQTKAEINSQTPEVGECIDEASMLIGNDTNVVDCGSAEAAWTVVSDAGSWNENDFDTVLLEELCAGISAEGSALWIGEQKADGSGNGQVVCLEPTTSG